MSTVAIVIACPRLKKCSHAIAYLLSFLVSSHMQFHVTWILISAPSKNYDWLFIWGLRATIFVHNVMLSEATAV